MRNGKHCIRRERKDENPRQKDVAQRKQRINETWSGGGEKSRARKRKKKKEGWELSEEKEKEEKGRQDINGKRWKK